MKEVEENGVTKLKETGQEWAEVNYVPGRQQFSGQKVKQLRSSYWRTILRAIRYANCESQVRVSFKP